MVLAMSVAVTLEGGVGAVLVLSGVVVKRLMALLDRVRSPSEATTRTL